MVVAPRFVLLANSLFLTQTPAKLAQTSAHDANGDFHPFHGLPPVPRTPFEPPNQDDDMDAQDAIKWWKEYGQQHQRIIPKGGKGAPVPPRFRLFPGYR